jgi:hypothetical protein
MLRWVSGIRKVVVLYVAETRVRLVFIVNAVFRRGATQRLGVENQGTGGSAPVRAAQKTRLSTSARITMPVGSAIGTRGPFCVGASSAVGSRGIACGWCRLAAGSGESRHAAADTYVFVPPNGRAAFPDERVVEWAFMRCSRGRMMRPSRRLMAS